jgi:hypothetical protein
VITSLPIDYGNFNIQLGLSIGRATALLTPDETLEAVFNRAKEELLRVKGRHQTINPPIETIIRVKGNQ